MNYFIVRRISFWVAIFVAAIIVILTAIFYKFGLGVILMLIWIILNVVWATTIDDLESEDLDTVIDFAEWGDED